MRENINKVSQRGERLDALQDKTDNLAVSAQGFRRGANRVRKQMWWKDMKMRMCLIAGIIILILVIVVPAGTFSSAAHHFIQFIYQTANLSVFPLQSLQHAGRSLELGGPGVHPPYILGGSLGATRMEVSNRFWAPISTGWWFWDGKSKVERCDLLRQYSTVEFVEL
jgi:hypothetical protein